MIKLLWEKIVNFWFKNVLDIFNYILFEVESTKRAKSCNTNWAMSYFSFNHSVLIRRREESLPNFNPLT